jgi:hypothetical protein
VRGGARAGTFSPVIDLTSTGGGHPVEPTCAAPLDILIDTCHLYFCAFFRENLSIYMGFEPIRTLPTQTLW